MKKKEYATFYYVKGHNTPFRVTGYYGIGKIKGGKIGQVLYANGNTYQICNLKNWDELNISQKEAVIESDYEHNIMDIYFQVAKDPTLRGHKKSWINCAKKEREKRLENLSEKIERMDHNSYYSN